MRNRSIKGILVTSFTMLLAVACAAPSTPAPTAAPAAPTAAPAKATAAPAPAQPTAVPAAAAPTVAAPATAAPQAASALKVLRIGNLGPMTGPQAAWGKFAQAGLEVGAEEINAAGGLKVGSDTYNLEIVTYDHKADVSEAAAQAKKIVFSDKLSYTFSQNSGPILALQEVTEPAKVMNLTVGDAVEVYKNKPYSFGVYPGPMTSYGAAYSFYANKFPDKKKVALVAEDNASYKSMFEQEKKDIAKVGAQTLVGETFFPPDTKDLYPVATKVISSKPDLVSILSASGNSAGLVKAMREQGYQGIFQVEASMNVEQFVQAAGKDASEGVYYLASFDPADPKTLPAHQTLNKKVMAKIGQSITGMAIAPYDGLLLLAAGVKAANSIDPTAVKDALPKIAFDLSWGKTALGMATISGDRPARAIIPTVISSIKGGKGSIDVFSWPPERKDRLTALGVKVD